MTPLGRSAAARPGEAAVTALIESLEGEGDYHAMDLARRLSRCQAGRDARAEDRHAVRPPPCRTVACRFCRRWEAKRWRKRVEAQFATADNGDCSLATIMLAKAANLEDLEQVIMQTRTELRNIRDRNARKDRRWRRTAMRGQFEFDWLASGDLQFLPPQRKRVIGGLPLEGAGGSLNADGDCGIWVLHLHLTVHHPRLGRGDVRDIFEKQWRGEAGRVDVKPFYAGSADENAGNILSYAHKHAMKTKFKDKIEIEWPRAVQAHFWAWLHSLRRGFSPLRVKIGAIEKAGLAARLLRSIENEPREQERFDGNPCIINTGGRGRPSAFARVKSPSPKKSSMGRVGQCAGMTSRELILRI